MANSYIYDAFTTARDTGRLTGDDPPGLKDLLTTLGVPVDEVSGSRTMLIANGSVQQNADSVTLSATVPSFLGTQWSLTLVGIDAGSQPARAMLDLTLDAGADTSVTLGTLFPKLPQSRVQLSATEGGGLTLGDSVVAPLQLTSCAVRASNVETDDRIPPPRLQGWLSVAGTPLWDNPYAKDFIGDQQLWLDGAFDYTASGSPLPKLHLDAPIPGLSIAVPKLALSAAGLRLVNDHPDPAPFPKAGAPLSAVLAYGTFTTPDGGSVDVTVPLLMGDYVWPFHFEFERGTFPLARGVELLTSLLGAEPSAFALPNGVPGLDLFEVSQIEFGYVPEADGPGSLAYSSVTIESSERWVPPVPFVAVENVGVTWVLYWGGEDTLAAASIWGTMSLGSPPDQLRMTVRVDLPDLSVTAYTEEPVSVSLPSVLASYFKSSSLAGDDPTTKLKIVSARVTAILPLQTYYAVLRVGSDPGLVIGSTDTVQFSFDWVELSVELEAGVIWGALSGTATVAIRGGAPLKLSAAAEYDGGSWTFEGGIASGSLDLVGLVGTFFTSENEVPPAWVDSISVELSDLWVRFSTKEGNPYYVRGRLDVSVTPFGVPMSLAAQGYVERTVISGETKTNGAVTAAFSVNRLVVTAGLSFADAAETYTFTVEFGALTLTGTTRQIDASDRAPAHNALELRLKGFTLGDVARELVHLANPNSSFRLDPPWDFLDSIDVSRAALVIDQALQTVSVEYDVVLSLPFLSLQKVGVVFDRSSATPTVRWRVEGSFLGAGGPGGQKLEWDAIDEAPPAIPGKGNRLFDLSFLALGQHVTPKGLTDYSSVGDVIAAMRKSLGEIDPSKPEELDELEFDTNSGWLLGLECSVMGTVDAQLVLHDPDLYGMVVSLKGAEAGSLAGLSFELLYKKVTKDIGVFHARLQIPDAFRSFQLGAVSITLGIITVDVYTNGNFRVDLGFPHDRVFDSSFAVEAGIFNGRGGIYFAVLDGATSSRVPAITNGVFSPVLELGIGLEVGVGRTFEKGPLKAALYVDLVAIVEGVLAWFHPADASAPVAPYYWCRGTVGITGKLYGSVDFKIVSASVSIEAHALATITFAAYEKTLVELDVGVTVEASLDAGLFTLSFHFDTRLQASFAIGDSGTPPWMLASGSSGPATRALASHVPRRRRAHDVIELTRGLHRDRRAVASESGDDTYRLAFDPGAKVFPGEEIREASLDLVPVFTRDEVPVQWGPVEPAPSDQYRIAFLLAADSAVPASAVSAADALEATVDLNARAATPTDTTFQQVSEAMLRWSLDALGVRGPDAQVTAAQLEDLVAQLALPQAADAGFTWANLETFFDNNLHFVLTAPPLARVPSVGGVPFPMLPPLTWSTSDAEQTRDFSEYQQVDSTYESQVIQFFAGLDPRPEGARPNPAQRLRAGRSDDTESMATFVTRDYFLMVARTIAQAASDLLARYPHVVTETDSLDSIARAFPPTTVPYVKRANDTVEDVAREVGMSVAEIAYLDPDFEAVFGAAEVGSPVMVPLGVTPGSIAAANTGCPLVPKQPVHLGDLAVTVTSAPSSTDTFDALAERYGTTAAAWLVPDHAVYGTSGLLRAGAAAQLTSFSYANPTALDLRTVAAVFFVRLPLQTEIPLVDWYEQAISQLNDVGDDGPLPAEVDVPVAFRNAAASPTPWSTLPGDTLRHVAGYCAVLQNSVDGDDFDEWLGAVKEANIPPNLPTIALPDGTAVTIAPGDTLQRLQDRLLVDASDHDRVPAFVQDLAAADILVPLAEVVVDDAVGRTAEGQTLLRLAEAYGLGVEDLGMRMAPDEGVLAWDGTNAVTVPAIPLIAVDDLVSDLHEPTPAGTVAGQVARYMLHGARMPAPVPVPVDPIDPGAVVYAAIGPMTGLYELMGQQLVGPPPVPESDPVLTLTVEKGGTADWLTFAESVQTAAGDDAASVESRYPGAASLNRALRLRERDGVLPEGMVVLTEQTDAVVLEITGDDLVYPDGVLVRSGDTLQPLQQWREVDVRHPLARVVPWTTTAPPLLPAAATDPATAFGLWAFSRDLLAAAAAETHTSYRLMQSAPMDPTGKPVEVAAYAWATTIRLAVRRAADARQVVEVLGAGTDDRRRLEKLVGYLRSPSVPNEQAHVRLLWELPVSAGAAPGLASAALDPAATFLVKTNLSTETRSHVTTTASPASPIPFFASTADVDVLSFLTLLWECSVVGGGGYWLHHGEDALPEGIFDQDGYAQLTLLAQLDSQSTTTEGGPLRTLIAANNCAVVGGSLDPTVAVWVVADDHAETERKATVPPGQVGFQLDLAAPSQIGDPSQAALESLYSLVGYRLAPTSSFNGSAGVEQGRPVGPQTPRDAEGNLEQGRWRIMQAIPISSFAKEVLRKDDPLPDPAEDPYAGINGASADGTLVVADAAIDVWFQDVLGNATAAPDGTGTDSSPAALILPVTYTDELLGPGSWPATVTSFCVERGATENAELRVRIGLQAPTFQPQPHETGSATAARAALQLARFASIYYQVLQPDVTASLSTTLCQDAGDDPIPLAVSPAPLLTLASAAYVHLEAIAACAQDTLPDLVTETTLEDVRAEYGLTFAAMADANARCVVADLLGVTSIDVPVIAVWAPGDSATTICKAVGPDADPVAMLQDEDNVGLPLTAGTEVRIPPTVHTLEAPSPPLSDLLVALGCTLPTFVAANSGTDGLLTPGFVFEANGLTVTVAPSGAGADTNLDLVAQHFDTAYGIVVDAQQLVERNAATGGMFRAGAALTVEGYVARSGETLKKNQSGYSVADLASCNAGTVDLFPPGTAVVVGTTATDVSTGETLQEVAATTNVLPGEVLRHNGTIGLPSTTPLVIPGLLQWPGDPASVVGPYVLGGDEELIPLAELFMAASGAAGDTRAVALARLNLSRRGVVAGGKTVTVGTVSVSTSAGDSFQDVLDRLGSSASLADLVDAIGDTSGYLAAGGMLLTPPAQVPASPSAGSKAGEVAAPLGFSATDLLGANLGVPDLLVAGAALAASPDGREEETVAPSDSLTAILARFHARGVTTTIDLLVAANPDALLLRANAALLLPPAPATLCADLGGARDGSPGWRFPGPVFPIHAWLDVSRAAALVDPDLAGTSARPSAVVRAKAAVPVMRTSGDATAPAEPIALATFATALEEAMPGVRVAAGKDSSEEGERGGTDVWGVVFAQGAIESVSVTPPLKVEGTSGPQPRTFALRPLATMPVSRDGVTTRSLTDDGVLSDTTQERSYRGVDMDVWARGFLSDVELVLSAPYVAEAKIANESALSSLLTTKQDVLGAAIASGLDYVFASEEEPAAKPLAAAVKVLEQQLALSFLRGYDTAALLQYDAVVDSSWSTEDTRISGRPAPRAGTEASLGKVSLSNGKVSLSDGSSHVTFVVTAPDVGAHAVVEEPLEFCVVELEHAIQKDPATGYDRSEWLTFVNRMDTQSAPVRIELGTPAIPFPLRAYPPLPVVLSHSADSRPPSPGVSTAPASPLPLPSSFEWSYTFRMRHQSVDQDEIHLLLELNQRPLLGSPEEAGQADLFAALAQYVEVSSGLMGILSELKEPATSGTARVSNALATFADQVGKVASAWQAHWKKPAPADAPAPPMAGGLAYESHQLVLKPIVAKDGSCYEAVRVTWPDIPATGVTWPCISWVTDSGAVESLVPDVAAQDVCGCRSASTCRCYILPVPPHGSNAEVPVPFAPLTLEIEFGGLTIGSYQNARAGVLVSRNANLLGPEGARTNSPFVYRTPRVGFPDPVVPLIDLTQRYEIGEWTSDPDENPLSEVFDALFDRSADNRQVAVMAAYLYELVDGPEPLETWLPAKLSPTFTYGDGTIAAIVEGLGTWAQAYRPQRSGGAWAFSVSMFSGLDPSLTRPVARLRNVVSHIAPPAAPG